MTNQRWMRAFGWGVVATIAMSIPMVIGVITEVAPMPKPIPVAVMGTLFGDGVPRPLLMTLGATVHMAFGGIWGVVFAELARPITVWKGISLGIVLWLGMQLVILPFLGWGVFGVSITPAIGVVTLMLHLVYGIALGWTLNRRLVVSEKPAVV